jgi:hypothetical protein
MKIAIFFFASTVLYNQRRSVRAGISSNTIGLGLKKSGSEETAFRAMGDGWTFQRHRASQPAQNLMTEASTDTTNLIFYLSH